MNTLLVIAAFLTVLGVMMSLAATYLVSDPLIIYGLAGVALAMIVLLFVAVVEDIPIGARVRRAFRSFNDSGRVSLGGMVALGLAALGLMALPWTVAAAPAAPDSMSIYSVRCWQSIMQASDALCITHYAIDYATAPTQTVTQAFLGRFVVAATEINSVAPQTYAGSTVATSSAPYHGYGEGVLSHYWSAADVISSGLTWGGSAAVVLQGNPSVFASLPTPVQYSSVDWITDQVSVDLAAHLFEIADSLALDWSANDIALTEVVGNQTVLSTQGESYFSAAIPNLPIMAPTMWTVRVSSPTGGSTDLGISEASGYEDFWTGTALETGWDSMASFLGLSSVPMVARMIVTLGLMVAVGVMAVSWSKRPALWFPAAVVVLALSVPIGLAPMALAIILGFCCVAALGFQYLYQRG